MVIKRHQMGTRTFAELTRSQRARVINATRMLYEKEIRHQIVHSPNPDETRQILADQVMRLVESRGRSCYWPRPTG